MSALPAFFLGMLFCAALIFVVHWAIGHRETVQGWVDSALKKK